MNSLFSSRILDLISATERGDEEYVKLLLSQGVPPDSFDQQSGLTALHAAVLNATKLLPVLLEYCSNPDPHSIGTPLSYVIHELIALPVEKRRKELLWAIDILQEAGADPRSGGSDQSPLELVRLYNLSDIEDRLIQNLEKK